MRRVKDLFGRTIVSADAGERLGEVNDVLIDDERRQVAALVIRTGWFSTERVVPFDAVRSLGGDAIIVESSRLVVDAREWNARQGQREVAPTAAAELDAGHARG